MGTVGGGADAGKSGRRSLDSEINMIPMIDLLMVTISFLLITAVWTHMSRVDASAKVPGDHVAPPCEGGEPCAPRPELHVDMRQPDRFVLSWRDRGAVIRTVDVTRHQTKRQVGPAGVAFVRFPELAAALTNEWSQGGAAAHGPGAERAVLHAPDDARYEEMIAAMDAIYQVRRADTSGAAPRTGGGAPAFMVTLATN
jgi:biopolymer transport protein ExbD